MKAEHLDIVFGCALLFVLIAGAILMIIGISGIVRDELKSWKR